MDKNLFWGGVPTEPDVKLIRNNWPDLPEGLAISYNDIARLLGIDAKSNRFLTVTTRWRSILFQEKNIVIGCRAGYKFVVLSPEGRVDLGARKIKTGMRIVRKSHRILVYTDRSRLSREGQAILDHSVNQARAIEHAATMESRRQAGPALGVGSAAG